MRSVRSVCSAKSRKAAGRQQAVARVLPAHQRLEAAEGRRWRASTCGWKNGIELAALEPVQQFGEQCLAPLDLAGAGSRGNSGRCRGRRPAPRPARSRRWRGPGRCRARRRTSSVTPMPQLDAPRAAADRERLGQRGLDPAGNHRGGVGVVELAGDHHEVVMPEIGGEIAGAQRLLDAARGDADDFVAGPLAQRLAQDLEAVEIEPKHRRLGLRAFGRRCDLCEVGMQIGGVRHAGQRVVQQAEAVLLVVLGGARDPVADPPAGGQDQPGDQQPLRPSRCSASERDRIWRARAAPPPPGRALLRGAFQFGQDPR